MLWVFTLLTIINFFWEGGAILLCKRDHIFMKS